MVHGMDSGSYEFFPFIFIILRYFSFQYLVINYIGVFDGPKLSPLGTIWGSLFAKANAVYNPIVYGISHPKYRAALKEKLPMLVCGETENPKSSDTASQATTGTSDGKP